MERATLLEEVQSCVVDLNMEGAVAAVQHALDNGVPSREILKEGLSRGLEKVGTKFEAGECYISDLIMVGEVMKASVAVLRSHWKGEVAEILGTIVLGTVEGDIHDIGKSVFATLAENAGFNVIDVGVDVSAERFLEVVKGRGPNILGLSALVTTTMTRMNEVIETMERAGLRRKLRVIAGGAPITDDYAKQVGADAGVNDAIKGLEICKGWMKRVDA